MATSDKDGQMSLRTPHLHTFNNDADEIESQLENYEHTKWGFLIYRCTYASDAHWAEFIRRIRYTINDSLTYFNGLDLLESMELTVIEDPKFNGASTSFVRQQFVNWISDGACEREQGIGKL
jgi:hypothetical protein